MKQRKLFADVGKGEEIHQSPMSSSFSFSEDVAFFYVDKSSL